MIVLDVGKYRVGVYRQGWEERNVWRWRPRTWIHVWLLAVLCIGAPILVLGSALPSQASWLSSALAPAAEAALFSGLLETWRLYRRRRKVRFLGRSREPAENAWHQYKW